MRISYWSSDVCSSEIRQWFEGRSELVEIIGHGVAPCLRIARDQLVRIIGRKRRHSQHFAGVDVEDDPRAADRLELGHGIAKLAFEHALRSEERSVGQA